MKLKSMLIASALFVMPSLHASSFYNLTTEPLRINQCALEVTGNPLDIALAGEGYFVISKEKKNHQLLFTRYGIIQTNSEGYLVTMYGDYLLAINKKSDPNRLSKIKLSPLHLSPKVTSHAHLIVNLPATSNIDADFTTFATIYDSVAGKHQLEARFTKEKKEEWAVQILVDGASLGTGQLTFNSIGELVKQEGFTHIPWPTDYGVNKLKINFKESTQFGASYTIKSIITDGYLPGELVGLTINSSGEILLGYSNGVMQKLPNRIAVAKFANPRYLQLVLNHVYQATEKSGTPRLHWLNGENAIYQGYLEQEPCFTH